MAPIFRVFVCLTLSLGFFGGAFADSTDDNSAQLRQLREDMASLQARLNRDLRLKDELSAELATIEQDLNVLRRTIRESEQSRREIEDTQMMLRRQLRALQESAQKRMADLSLLILKGYPIDHYSTLKLLLNQENPRQAARLLAYHKLLTEHSVLTLEQLSSDIASIDETQRQLVNQAQTLQQLIAQQEKDLQEANDLGKRRQLALAEITQEINQSNLALERLRQDEARLAEILTLAKDQSLDATTLETPPNVLAMKGSLPMPTRGEIQHTFGQPRGGGHRWRGWLIETESGSPVHAIASGRVVYSNWLRGYGLLMIIDHQDQILSLYAHNETLFFEVGDWVRQGEQIATASQARADPLNNGSGIYFELRENGEPKDPAAWLNPNRLP